MSADRRLERLYAALSAKERVILILRAWKAGEDHDPKIRYTLPTKQSYEYNRLIDLLRGASGDLTQYIVVVHGLIEQLDLRYAWLATLHLSALDASFLTSYFTMDSDEPITRSEYQQKEAQARAEWLSVSDLAEGLCLEEDDGDESEAAWRRRLRAKREEFARLVAAGTLVGKGTGPGMRIEAASYYAWRGEPVHVAPEWGRAYDVRPDAAKDQVERERAVRRRARMLLGRFALGMVEGRPVERCEDQATCTGDTIAGELVATVREDWPQRWRELRAVEVVVGEVAEELDGEDPLMPEVRGMLTESRDRLIELREKLQPYTGSLRQEEPDAEPLARLQRLVRDG